MNGVRRSGLAWGEAVVVFGAGPWDVDRLVSDRVPFREAPALYARLVRDGAGVMRSWWGGEGGRCSVGAADGFRRG
jgi:threonine dehydrogenase-like Zn-dependent dehydrogenase